jgi:hypothetical protein
MHSEIVELRLKVVKPFFWRSGELEIWLETSGGLTSFGFRFLFLGVAFSFLICKNSSSAFSFLGAGILAEREYFLGLLKLSTNFFESKY